MKQHFTLLVTFLFLCSGLYAQKITSISPASVSPGQSYSIFIRGQNTHFQNGVSVADFGSGITVQNLNITNAQTATASIIVSGGVSVGNRDVKITTGREVANMSSGLQVFTQGSALVASITLIPIETINLKNIDLTNPAGTPVLFYTDVNDDNTNRHVNITLSLSNTTGLLGSMSLKNQSLASGSKSRYSNRQYTSVKINGVAGNNFLSIVEATGTFPADNYTYELVVTDATTGTVLATANAVNSITNPILNPELITPGMNFSSNIPDIYTSTPMFQWFGQNDKYDFALYFYQSGQTSEEVVRTRPIYRDTAIRGNSFMYPNFPEPLIDGKTYAWQIQGRVNTATGIQYKPSEVFRFTYNEPGKSKHIVSSIQITPAEISLSTGQQCQFTVLCYDQNGALVTNVTPVWQVTPAQGSITQTGLFTAGNQPATMAVVVSAGIATQYATININLSASAATQEFLIDGLVQQLFGLPKQ